ncbi:SH3 domain-containing protein [Peribacillus deserti]|uniref:SH3b domain-containing protein n=1 Tax=Peribacillus deserti TaxID=673318 RepID=A0A2N5M6Q6_9BACI|nr:SH3 domain-containing protein [Peribacillus deserti]PLT30039.1 hypothetical protein CUU66_09835 [Peribacillus deserti]
MHKKTLLQGISKGIIATTILSSSLLLPQLPSSIAPAKVEAAAPIYTVNASSLNVRSGAGTNYARIGILPRGSRIDVIQKLSNGWYKISYKGKTGYVSGQYVKTTAAAAPVYRVKATSLNVRTGPSTKYASIGSLKNGAVINVIRKESNGWYRINFNGKTGYVSGQYVTTGSVSTAKRLNVPLIAQRPELPSGCEATSLAMALNYYGVKVSKTTLANKMPYDKTKLLRNADGTIKIWGDPNVGFVGTPFGNGYTINPGPLKRVLDQYRSGGVNLTGKSFSEVESYIRKGKPVLAWFTINYEMPSKRTWKTTAGKTINAPKPLHCIVVTGVDANYVYFNDSEARKKDVKISKSKFISVYNAMGKRALAVN